MKTPITDAINRYKEHISFHTPAHCGVLSPYDITELSYSGNLLSHEGVINESEQLVSKAYGAECTLFVTSGATIALHAAMAVFWGETFLVLGAAHKAIFSGLRLFAKDAFYLDEYALLEKALKDIRPRALIVTSPDYFGNTLNLNNISVLCARLGVALIIDAAHGAHFPFCSKLPYSATFYGDLVIHSLHKTMPVLTGGAVLHCKKEYYEKAVFAMGELHTSSPSYPVMQSIEAAVAAMEQDGERLWSEVLDEVHKFAKGLSSPYRYIKNDDPSRLVIASPYEGAEVAKALETKGIFCEMSYEDTVVFIVNPYNADKLPMLQNALERIGGLNDCKQQLQFPFYGTPRKLTIRGVCKRVSLQDAIGKTLHREIGCYPPGVPLFLPGHVLSKRDIEFLSVFGKSFFGIDNGAVFVVSY